MSTGSTGLTSDVPVLAVHKDPVKAAAGHRPRQIASRQHLPCAKGKAAAGVQGSAQLVRFVHYGCHGEWLGCSKVKQESNNMGMS